jgi:hypothetical protein
MNKSMCRVIVREKKLIRVEVNEFSVELSQKKFSYCFGGSEIVIKSIKENYYEVMIRSY